MSWPFSLPMDDLNLPPLLVLMVTLASVLSSLLIPLLILALLHQTLPQQGWHSLPNASKTERGPGQRFSSTVLTSASHKMCLDGIPGSRLLPGSVPAFTGIWQENR